MKRIVFCIPGNSFSEKASECWDNMVKFCNDESNGIHMIISRGWVNGNCYWVRNKCLHGNNTKKYTQKPFQNLIKYDYIMWIDSDIIYTPKQMVQLINRDKDIVAGWYKLGDRLSVSAGADWDTEFYKKNGYFKPLDAGNLSKSKDLVEVYYTGFGFVLMKNGVMESLDYPWFRPEYPEIGDDIEEFAGEDTSFGINIREKGFKIYVDPTVNVGHEKMIIIY